VGEPPATKDNAIYVSGHGFVGVWYWPVTGK
jgi:hypothetical protein